jgi:hypothetical protein
MKTYFSNKVATSYAFAKAILVALIVSACADNEVTPVLPDDSSSSSVVDHRESSEGRKNKHHQGPNYNLNVILLGESRWSFGFIKFRQYENETQMIHLDTWVHHLEPNTSYVLQRAVDTTLDGDCTSTSWLTLGEGLIAKSIVTDSHGSGSAELFRSVAAIPVGTTFDIHFQIVKEGTTEVVLASDCYEYTVR